MHNFEYNKIKIYLLQGKVKIKDTINDYLILTNEANT